MKTERRATIRTRVQITLFTEQPSIDRLPRERFNVAQNARSPLGGYGIKTHGSQASSPGGLTKFGRRCVIPVVLHVAGLRPCIWRFQIVGGGVASRTILISAADRIAWVFQWHLRSRSLRSSAEIWPNGECRVAIPCVLGSKWRLGTRHEFSRWS